MANFWGLKRPASACSAQAALPSPTLHSLLCPFGTHQNVILANKEWRCWLALAGAAGAVVAALCLHLFLAVRIVICRQIGHRLCCVERARDLRA